MFGPALPARGARVIAKAFDSGGRLVKQYELCSEHGRRIAEREKRKGRSVRILLD